MSKTAMNIVTCVLIVLMSMVWFMAGVEAGHYDYQPERLSVWADEKNNTAYIMLPNGHVHSYNYVQSGSEDRSAR